MSEKRCYTVQELQEILGVSRPTIYNLLKKKEFRWIQLDGGKYRISYKDLKPFMADLKLVYKADTEDLALTALEDLEEKWGKKYPASIGSWRNNWTQLSTYFKYPSEIRKLIYTTNSIENFNRQLRKVTKSKTIFPTDDALFKMLYLAMMDATKKWTGKAWDWGLTLDQLCIYFGDRIQPEDID